MEEHDRAGLAKRRCLPPLVQTHRPERGHHDDGLLVGRDTPLQRSAKRQRDHLLGSTSKRHKFFALIHTKKENQVSVSTSVGFLNCRRFQVPGRPVFCVNRESNTNQKIALDVSTCGKWLVSGGTDGKVQVWNVAENVSPTVHMQVSFVFRVF